MASKKGSNKKTAKKGGCKKSCKSKPVKKTAPKSKKPAKKTAAVKKSKAAKTVARKTAVKKSAPKKTVIKKPAAPKKINNKKPAPKITVPANTVTKHVVAAPVAQEQVKRPSLLDKPASKLTAREKSLLEIRLRLIGQKDVILSEAETAMNSLPEQTIFPDLGDQATAETDRNFMLRLRGREQKLLNKIEEAIERIEAGTFGICESCGEEISIERLIARPVATLCIDCKEEQEEEEKLQGS